MITSTANPRIKRIRALQSERKTRASEGKFVIEGPLLLREALAAGIVPELVLHTEDFAASGGGAALLARLDATRLDMLLPVSQSVFKAASDTQTPQGILAVVPMPAIPIPPDPDYLLVLDGLQNPGNLGAILRSAEAAAVPGILLAPGTVDSYNPKVVRAAAGAHFRLPLETPPDWQTIDRRLAGLTVYLADASGGAYYDHVDWRAPSALILGSEAHGAGRQVSARSHVRVTIPMSGGAESLNVAVAAGILLFEAARQRAQLTT